jgi:ABC-2 type transport system ATP-binding protein
LERKQKQQMSTDTINTPAKEQGHVCPAVEAQALVKMFGENRAVDGIDLVVPVGMVYGVLGPNGAGKTTMINILATLLRADSGTAKVFGHDVQKEANIVRQLMRVTGQYASLDEALTAFENLVIFSRLLGLSPAQARKRTNDLLEEFELTDAARRPVSKFSGGMRRRLDLAASIISQTPLLFLDEPTTGLDPHNRARMWTLVRRLVAQGTTVILTTQYLDEADQLADRIAVIDHGRVVAEGATNELKASVGTTSLHVQLMEQGDGDSAMSTIGRVLGTKGTLIDSKHISAPMANPDLVADLLVAFRDAKIRLAELSVQKPTLDEVFLTLTGHGTTEEPKENLE